MSKTTEVEKAPTNAKQIMVRPGRKTVWRVKVKGKIMENKYY